jgi:hypothetical protein
VASIKRHRLFPPHAVLLRFSFRNTSPERLLRFPYEWSIARSEGKSCKINKFIVRANTKLCFANFLSPTFPLKKTFSLTFHCVSVSGKESENTAKIYEISILSAKRVKIGHKILSEKAQNVSVFSR